MRILLLSRYGRMGASSRVRSLQYLPYLEQNGFRVDVASLLGDDYLIERYAEDVSIATVIRNYYSRVRKMKDRGRYDLIWVEKELFPWIPGWLEGLFLRSRVPYVVDYDDAQFHRYDTYPDLLVRALLSSKIASVMKQASMVIVGNDYLAEWAKNAGAHRIECLPTVVDNACYVPSRSGGSQQLCIGWIGTPRTSKYLKLVLKPLAVMNTRWNCKVLAVGAQSSPPVGYPVEVAPWNESTEVEQIQRFDIGIMPLPDDPFERGKCGYKLIQYMACAKPVVASPVGVNAKIVEHGQNGFLASNADEWEKALDVLCGDSNLRATMGSAGRKMVEEEFSLQVTAPRLANLLREAAGR